MAPSRYYERIKDNLKDFGSNPVADVGFIMTLVQGMKIPEKDVMKTVQDIYVTHYQAAKGADANKARQSWVAASGNSFEEFMRRLINTALNEEGILAIKGDRLRQLPSAAKIVEFLTLKANPGQQPSKKGRGVPGSCLFNKSRNNRVLSGAKAELPTRRRRRLAPRGSAALAAGRGA